MKKLNRYFIDLFLLVGSLALLQFSNIALGTIEQFKPINGPESEVSSALQKLEDINIRLRNLKNLNTSPGHDGQRYSSMRHYHEGIEFYRKGEYLSSIREFTSFLHTVQVADPSFYLQANYFLGRALEETFSRREAMQVYMHYLSTFLTAPAKDFTQLRDVLKHFLPMLSELSISDQRALYETLSTLVTLELPSEHKAAVNFLTSMIAIEIGKNEFAEKWSTQAEIELKNQYDPVLKAQISFIKGLNDLSVKQYDSSEQNLRNVLEIQSTEIDDIKNQTRLNLGRIASARKKFETAINYYTAVEKNSSFFKDALFESIHVHILKSETSLAQNKASQFISLYFPFEQQKIRHLRNLLAYLDLKANDPSSAKKILSANNFSLNNLSKWIHSFKKKESLKPLDISELYLRSSLEVQPPPVVVKSYQQVQDLNNLTARLSEIRGNLRNIIFSIGQENPENLRPVWKNQTEQLQQISFELLNVGHHLAAVERHLYKSNFSPAQKQSLDASEKRRVQLLSEVASMHRMSSDWKSIHAFLKMTQEVAQNLQKLNDSKAALSSLSSSSLRSSKIDASTRKKIKSLEEKSEVLSESFYLSLENLRKQRALYLLTNTPSKHLKKFVTQYAANLNDESFLLEEHRSTVIDVPSKLLSQDFSSAWKTWRFLVKELYGHIDGVQGDMEDTLISLISNLDGLEETHQKLNSAEKAISSSLMTLLSIKLDSIVQDYDIAFAKQKSKNMKLAADVEWLSFNKLEENEMKIHEKSDLEKQIISDQLFEIEQGVKIK